METKPKKEEVKVEEVKAPSAETITLTKGQLEAMIDDRIKNKGVPEKPRRVTDRTARLRFHNGQAVVKYANVREKLDVSTGRPLAWMDITLEDGSVHTVPYLEFLNSQNSALVQIKRMQVEEVVVSEGSLRTQNPNPKDIKNWSGSEIEAVVTHENRVMEVVVLDGEYKGREIKVDGNALNS